MPLIRRTNFSISVNLRSRKRSPTSTTNSGRIIYLLLTFYTFQIIESSLSSGVCHPKVLFVIPFWNAMILVVFINWFGPEHPKRQMLPLHHAKVIQRGNYLCNHEWELGEKGLKCFEKTFFSEEKKSCSLCKEGLLQPMVINRSR